MSLKNQRDSAGRRGGPDARDVFDSFPRRRRGGGRRRRRFIRPVLVACAVLAVLVAVDYWANYDRIYRGVTVGDVSLSGKTPEEARRMIEERTTGSLGSIELTGGPEQGTLTSKELGMNLDAQATADEAYSIGRQGGVLERLGDRMEATWGSVNVTPAVDYDRNVAQKKIQNLAARSNAEARDASVDVNGDKAEVTGSREGYAVDVPATVENVDGAIKGLSGQAAVVAGTVEPAVETPAAEKAASEADEAISDGPVVLKDGDEEWKVSPEKIGQALSFTPNDGEIEVGLDRDGLKSALSDVYDDLTVDPVEAGFEFSGNGVDVTKSQTGKSIKSEDLYDDMSSGLFSGQREFQVPVATAEPDLTTEQAEKLKPTELIGSYRTDYTLSSDQSPERVENLDIASNAISGNFLAPGEVFSLNEVASPLQYNSTKVIVEGAETHADGGGLCQVTSTLYMAANYAGLDILERTPHYAQLPYIRPGMDATVWFGALDMKFENTTDGYILLREYVADDGYIYAEIWGQPQDVEVEMDSEPEYMGDDYSEWITYQKVKKDGKVVYDDVLHKDSYKPLVDEKGRPIPPPEVPVAPVNP